MSLRYHAKLQLRLKLRTLGSFNLQEDSKAFRNGPQKKKRGSDRERQREREREREKDIPRGPQRRPMCRGPCFHQETAAPDGPAWPGPSLTGGLFAAQKKKMSRQFLNWGRGGSGFGCTQQLKRPKGPCPVSSKVDFVEDSISGILLIRP